MNHLDGHLAFGVDLGKLVVDVLQDALSDLGSGHVGDQPDREFTCWLEGDGSARCASAVLRDCSHPGRERG